MWLLFKQVKKYNQYIPLQLTYNKRYILSRWAAISILNWGFKTYLLYKTHIALELCSIVEHCGTFTWCCFAEEQPLLLECHFSIKAFGALLP